MLLLAVDTSGKFGSIALARCEKEHPCWVLETVLLEGGTFSAELVPQISSLLQRSGLTKGNLDAFAVITGPGSFTGLRIGLAVVKALAETLEKPIAAVSLLEVIAAQGEASGQVTAALDAGRGEIYNGAYEISENTGSLPCVMSERLLNRDEFISSVSGTVVTPEAWIADLARSANMQVKEIARPNAAALVPIGWRKIQAQLLISPEDLEANYIRRSDARMPAKPE